MKSLLFGRECLKSEIPEALFCEMGSDKQIVERPTAIKKKGDFYCLRCQTKMIPTTASECYCEANCAYCRNCLKMGKVRACDSFYTIEEPNAFLIRENILEWNGKLSDQQAEASEAIIQSIHKNETRLLWAVAGAGKTEMLFSGIEEAIRQQKRICIATPRVDVVLELSPRIQQAFPSIPLSTLYGGMEEPYSYRQIVVATTHQLYRFHEAFDVLIIDEVDAFPFHLDESLNFAANKARKSLSTLIYLSATPDQNMQKELSKGNLKGTILPARYHGYALPVPKSRYSPDWKSKVLKNPLKTNIGREMAKRIASKKRFIVFVPNIAWMLRFEQVLQNIFPTAIFEAVHSADSHREEKVMRMRQQCLDFILTTTILERGVTFPNVDVLVIGAEDRVFTESALVQIAGRAGRSPNYPTGDVYYFHNGQTIAIKRAIKQINQMNKMAKKRGLIH